MVSKTALFLCLLAVVLTVVSAVSARELAETNAAEKTNGLEDDPNCGDPIGGGGGYGRGGGYGGCGRCSYGCCGPGNYGCRCCTYAGEAVDADLESEPQN